VSCGGAAPGFVLGARDFGVLGESTGSPGQRFGTSRNLPPSGRPIGPESLIW